MKISVCLASYNGEKYIAQQITSILEQLGEHDELIISDDGSSDGTIAVIRGIQDKRINLLTGKVFRSVSFNMENALKHATGDIILMSDQDDIWMPGRVDHYKNRLAQYDLVVTDCILVNDKLETINPSFFQYKKAGKGLIKNLAVNTYMGCCMGFRRELLAKVLPFPRYIPMHDMWIGMSAEMAGKVTFDKVPYLWHRRHDSNTSTTGHRTKSGLAKILLFRLRMLRSLFVMIGRNYLNPSSR